MVSNNLVTRGEGLMFAATMPYDTGYLDVGDGHQLYYQQIGNPKGRVVLLVHGGPGLGIEAGSRYTRLHDPKHFRLIAVDQRGCGASRPHVADDRAAALRHNTPRKLADDFEKLRTHLNIPSWHVFGWSWGSCLGAYYASLYPKVLKSLTLGGIWMHTAAEIDWYINRMGLFLPEAEAQLLKLLPATTKRFDRLGTLYKLLMGRDKAKALRVAAAQGRFEEAAVYFSPPDEWRGAAPKLSKKQQAAENKIMVALGALEIFYMQKNPLRDGWYKTAAVKKALRQIKDFVLIQGRYDIVCPPTTAFELAAAHPHAKLTMVHYAGHSTREAANVAAILTANDRLKK